MTNDECTVDLIVASGEMSGVAAGDDDATGRDAPFYGYGFGTGDIDDVGAGGDDGVGTQHGFLFHHHAFNYDAAASDEAVVFDNDRGCLYGFEYATNAYTTAEVYVFAYLGATAHGGPSVDHGAAVYIGTNVDIGRHQHDSGSQIGSMASYGMGHYAHLTVGIVVF